MDTRSLHSTVHCNYKVCSAVLLLEQSIKLNCLNIHPPTMETTSSINAVAVVDDPITELKKPLITSTKSSSSTQSITTKTTTTNNMTTPSQGIMSIDTIRTEMQDLHDSCINHTYAWRLDQLNRMEKMLTEQWQEFVDAVCADLGSCTMEVGLLQIEMVLVDLKTIRSKYLKKYTQPKRVSSPLLLIPACTKLIPMPLNGPAVLVIGPSNYPLSMSLQPTVGALAAGNPVVIKPSEHCPATAAVFEKYIHQYFDSNAVRIVQGEIPETTALLERPWGKIFFTGSTVVGRIVAQAAANTLTPTVLELGGKCPCIVDPETCDPNRTDLTLIANRILWAKFMNCGQSCAAVDTVFVSEDMLEKLLPYIVKSLHKQYGSDDVMFDSKKSAMGRIVTKRAAHRLYQVIEEVEQYIAKESKTTNTDTTTADKGTSSSSSKCQIVLGGTKYCNIDSKFIAPTIIINPPPDCALMKDEVFGPILPIITIPSRQQIIEYIHKSMHPKTTPLCMYVFTKTEASYQQYITQIRSGSVMRNDCMVHISSPSVAFGGLGTSGYGTYHGYHSLETFTQWLPTMYRPLLPGSDLDMIRYPPFKPRTFKYWFVLDVATKLPDIPVLFVPEVLTITTMIVLFGLGAAIAFMYIPHLA